MEASEPNRPPQEQPGASNSLPPNPPSVEAAYKRKCSELKKRLQEVEANNDAMRVRNERGNRYIQKMRLETSILLERLTLLTGMTDENGLNPELRARAMAFMNERGGMIEDAGEGLADRPSAPRRVPDEEDYLDDESVGSETEKPPTPEERPIRPKKNRKTDEQAKNDEAVDNNADSVSSTFPTLMFTAFAPHALATGYNQPGPSQHPFTPIAPSSIASSAMDIHRAAATTTSPMHPASDSHMHHTGRSSFTPVASAPENHDRYVSAFEDFTNRNREKKASVLRRTLGPEATDEDIERALASLWENLDPEEKREYSDRFGRSAAN